MSTLPNRHGSPFTCVRLCTLIALLTACGHSLWAMDTANDQHARTRVTDLTPPAHWTEGEMGTMQVGRAQCRQDIAPDLVRSRIANIAQQEWQFFGSLDYQPREDRDRSLPRRSDLSETESIRVASTIAGYWSSSVHGSWIIERQNQAWNSEQGLGARWDDAWSAAFVSWVMCEAGLAEPSQFEHAIAHHHYIDQAIQARDGELSGTAYLAYDNGEQPVAVGDLLCTGSRPRYQSLDQRRAQLQEGARTHCDIVVAVNPEPGQYTVIGGNLQSAVRRKVVFTQDGKLYSPNNRTPRLVFAHLKLNPRSY